MAASKKKKPPEPASSKFLRALLRVAGVLAALLIAWMLIEGSSVRLKSASLAVDDLPSSFEGTRVLYLSDLHINSLNSVEKVSALITELKKLSPDLLLLGGDYTNFDPLMRISAGSSGKTGVYALEAEYRDLFFSDFRISIRRWANTASPVSTTTSSSAAQAYRWRTPCSLAA